MSREDYPTTGRPSAIATEHFDLSAAITAASEDLDYSSDPLRQIYVGGAGTIALRMAPDREGNQPWVEYDLPAGTWMAGDWTGVGVAGARAPTATKLVAQR